MSLLNNQYRCAIVVIFSIVVVAGCLSGPTPPTSTTTQSNTTTVETAVTPSDATGTNTVNMSELTETEQAAFSAAQNDSVSFGPRCADTYPYDSLETFREHKYVRADGVYYRLTATTGTQMYYARTYEPVVVNTTDTTETVQFDTLSGENRTIAEELLAGEYTSSYCDSGPIPIILSGDVAIRYNGETYVAQPTADADFPEWQLTVERVRKPSSN
ncbi:hypothetical protein [Halosegnis longus]|uniref:hypothetical protein n=1 Tax=Halosegnis longus TaxID=2216012 RepID=UPI00117D69BA|nr:hypothetical protein [Salella cibi]